MRVALKKLNKLTFELQFKGLQSIIHSWSKDEKKCFRYNNIKVAFKKLNKLAFELQFKGLQSMIHSWSKDEKKCFKYNNMKVTLKKFNKNRPSNHNSKVNNP